jgi:hypothetical protein
MPNFGKLLDKAKQLAGKHPDQVNKGVDQGEHYADEKTGGKHDRQIHEGGQKAEDYLGTQGQGSPGQGSGNQQQG